MSETMDNPDAAEEKGKPAVPATEWVLTSEDDFRAALPKMMNYRGLIMQALAAKMGGRQLFSAFIRGKQAHIRADSLFDAVLAMGLEVVVRPPQTSKTRQRIDAVRAQTLARRAKAARELADSLTQQAEGALQQVGDATDV